MAIKILIGGSPCTYWSIAQKNDRETKAEGMGWELFKNYLIAKEKFKPDFFLYENNKSAAQAIKDQIAEEFGVGVDPNVRFTYINSALVSAQNRQRFYVTNFGDIEQPKDRGILLKDILESGCSDREYLQKNQNTMALEPVENTYLTHVCDYDATALDTLRVAYIDLSESQGYRVYSTEHKSVCLRAQGGGRGGELIAEPARIPEYGTPDKSRPVRASCAYKGSGEGSLKTEAFPDNPNKQVSDYVAEAVQMSIFDAELTPPCDPRGGEKSRTITSGYHICSQRDLRMDIETDGFMGKQGVVEPIRVGAMPRPNGELSTSQGFRIYSPDGKAVTIKGEAGGAGGKTGMYAIPIEFDGDGEPTKAVSSADGKAYPLYKVVDGMITIRDKQCPIKLADGYYIIRKLTVTECARLQTMPDDYCKAVSDSQAYKALGNGWTAEVIIHLLNHALKDVPRDEEIVVLSMYDGIATGRYCLDKMGFTNVTYHAYEIDKYPIMVAMDNYPDIIQHGDAFAVREDDWQPPQTRSEWLDKLLGGDS